MNELLDLAQSVAVQAGEHALERRRGHIAVADTKSNDLDIVTVVDREVEQLIRQLIGRERPHDGFFGEEAGANAGSSGVTWVIDPIDGTVNFLYDIPHWAVSIAAVEGDITGNDWRVLAGAVLNPNSQELFSATADGPADCNGRSIRVNPAPALGHALVATGFAYDRQTATAQARQLAELRGQIRDVRRLGAASLDLCSVACGRVDAYFEAATSPWDYAAASLIAERAGARVGGFAGTRPNRDLVLAAPEPLYSELEAFLAQRAGDVARGNPRAH